MASAGVCSGRDSQRTIEVLRYYCEEVPVSLVLLYRNNEEATVLGLRTDCSAPRTGKTRPTSVSVPRAALKGSVAQTS